MRARPIARPLMAVTASLLLTGCIIVKETQRPASAVSLPPPEATGAEPAPDDRLNATLWAQQSVEYKATTEGIYALAALRLEEALADPDRTAVPEAQGAGYQDLPPAIILDADETVLDNSPYQAERILNDGKDYTDPSWNAWAGAGVAEAVPGAVRFTQAAAARGVKVFYVTNRDASTEAGTARNLRALGFPMDGNADTLLMKGEQPGWGSAKGTRRAVIAADYRVVMLLGDNFGDFTDAYKGTPAERLDVYEAHADRWGRDWIMLPNPQYGSWESSAFGDDYALSPEDRRRLKQEQLQPWPEDVQP